MLVGRPGSVAVCLRLPTVRHFPIVVTEYGDIVRVDDFCGRVLIDGQAGGPTYTLDLTSADLARFAPQPG